MKTKAVSFYVVLIGVAALLCAVVQNGHSVKATYSQFLQQVQSGQVTGATIVAAHSGANQVTYELKNGSQLQAVVPSDYRGVLEALQQKMVNIEIRDAQPWMGLVLNASPFLLLLGFWAFLMPRLPGRGAR